MNIFIVGPMGSGKSTVGKIISSELFLNSLTVMKKLKQELEHQLTGSLILKEKKVLGKEKVKFLKKWFKKIQLFYPLVEE